MSFTLARALLEEHAVLDQLRWGLLVPNEHVQPQPRKLLNSNRRQTSSTKLVAHIFFCNVCECFDML